jgi:hypothetical protein
VTHRRRAGGRAVSAAVCEAAFVAEAAWVCRASFDFEDSVIYHVTAARLTGQRLGSVRDGLCGGRL